MALDESAYKASLSKFDQELYDANEKDIARRAETFSFDLKRFVSRIDACDTWQKLLQAHLYLDHVVSKALNDALVCPSAILTSRMGFAQKASLIEALGILPAEILIPIRAINRLRNKAAHELDFEISEDDARSIVDKVPKALRYLVEQTRDTAESPQHFGMVLKFMVVQTEIMRHENVRIRLTSRQRDLKLGYAFSNLKQMRQEGALDFLQTADE